MLSACRRLCGRVARVSNAAGQSALNLLLPTGCPGCDAPSDEDNARPFCQACLRELPLFAGPRCERCGAPSILVTGDRPLPCGRCRDTRWGFDRAVALGAYEGPLRTLVLRSKHAAEEPVSLALGELLWRSLGDRLAAERADAVAVVPMHWRRRLFRQTNAPELMGEILARRLQAPFAPRLLRRVRPTQQQTKVAPSSRLPNVRRAFAVRRGYGVEGATILLIDDILTTGATCSESAKALKRAGAERVVVVVAARSL